MTDNGPGSQVWERVRVELRGIVGEATVEFMRQFKVDHAVIGASAIDEEGSILDYDYREVRVAQEIIRHARRTILVADHMKFDRNAPVRIGHLRDIDVLVTDAEVPESVQELCALNGVTIARAPGILSEQSSS